MKQVIQSYRTGALELAEVPTPAPRANGILVRTVVSLVSVGTERFMLEMARKSLVGKALARPDLVRQVVNKVRTEGLGEAYRQAMGRLDDPVPLGYSSAGIVVETGASSTGFSIGDRVACSGSGFASHAEFVSMPRTLAVKVPDGVGLDEAAFVTLGAIALHAVRMAEVAVGDRCVVLGLGLIGQLAVQILEAAGCRVLGADLDPAKVSLAQELGAHAGAVMGREDLAQAAAAFSGGAGADAVLVFAATESNEPIEQAASAARVRGRIVVPGLVGLALPRKVFYEKELSFVVSRAWGPGLYDPSYEQKGIDYPVPFVRWTAQRNLGQFLDLVADGKVRIRPLISHRFPIDRALETYDAILSGKERFLGVLLDYPEAPERVETIRLTGSAERGAADAGRARGAEPGAAREGAAPSARRSTVRVGMVGAGLFARGTLLPALVKCGGLELRGLATSSGVSGHHIGRRYGFAYCTTRVEEVIEDPETDLILILTRHGSHAALASRALAAGKHVFVEKPLAITEEQLLEVERAARAGPGQLMVGFNRRFAPTVTAALGRLESVSEPVSVLIRVNAGSVPRESWVHDPIEGGGRIIGEVCHFVDLAQALTRSRPLRVFAEPLRPGGRGAPETDSVSLAIAMENGSLATILYAAGGDKSTSRERVEVFGGGATCVIDNFRTLEWSRDGRRARKGSMLSAVDRGHRAELAVLLKRIASGAAFPVPLHEYLDTTRTTFAAVASLARRRPVTLGEPPDAGTS